MSAERRLKLAEVAVLMLDACDARTRARAAIFDRAARREHEASRLAITPALARLYELWGLPKEATGREAREMVRAGGLGPNLKKEPAANLRRGRR